MNNESDLEKPADDQAKASVGDAAPAPVSVRNVWITVLTVLAVLHFLRSASSIIIPVILGVLTSYAISPVVNVMEKWHIHRAVGAAVLGELRVSLIISLRK